MSIKLQKPKDEYNFLLLDLRFLLIETFASHGQIPCVPVTEGKKLEITEKS